jgi:hypothetical protein
MAARFQLTFVVGKTNLSDNCVGRWSCFSRPNSAYQWSHRAKYSHCRNSCHGQLWRYDDLSGARPLLLLASFFRERACARVRVCSCFVCVCVCARARVADLYVITLILFGIIFWSWCLRCLPLKRLDVTNFICGVQNDGLNDGESLGSPQCKAVGSNSFSRHAFTPESSTSTKNIRRYCRPSFPDESDPLTLRSAAGDCRKDGKKNFIHISRLATFSQ